MAYPLVELVAANHTASERGGNLTPCPCFPGPALFPEWDGGGLWKRTKTVKAHIQYLIACTGQGRGQAAGRLGADRR